MTYSAATTVEQYLTEMPEPRKSEVQKILSVVRQNLPQGYEEAMAWGMIAFQVPMSISGPTYNKQPLAVIAIANQKNYISIYFSSIYASADLTKEFQDRWNQSGKTLNMGKSCVRIKSIRDADLETISWAASLLDPEQFSQMYLRARASID